MRTSLKMASFREQTDDIPEIYDVIIIGAGPCGLATAARLREERPSALFTDEEHARFSWISSKASLKNRRNGRVRAADGSHSPCSRTSILVLDESGDQWLTKWKTLFRKLQISHLRSPMFFHPDPSDRDALLAFCHETGRTAEMREITGCVGKEISKNRQRKRRTQTPQRTCTKTAIEINERDRNDYFTPSSSCFTDFCDACINKYCLTGDLIKQDVVEEVEYEPSDEEGSAVLHVRTRTSKYLARSVVLAVGAGAPITSHPFPADLPTSASHVSDASIPTLFSQRLASCIEAGKSTNILVVGGGLTAAQTVDACIQRGANKVWLLMRGHWKVKQFDLDLTWMSKFRNHQRSIFWNADGFEERLSLIQQARGGGSMTTAASKLLKQYVSKGRLVVHTNTTITSQQFDETSESWSITSNPEVADFPCFDHVFLATGTRTDINDMPMLQNLLRSHPIQTVSGLPIVNTNLAWSDDIPLFISGKMAMLQLGPGAGNLEGAREGAERISWAIDSLLRRKSSCSAGNTLGKDDLNEDYVVGVGNKFARLGHDDLDSF